MVFQCNFKKFLKPRLRDDLNCFPDTTFESMSLVERKEMRARCIMLPRKKLINVFLENLVLGIDLAMAEKSKYSLSTTC